MEPRLFVAPLPWMYTTAGSLPTVGVAAAAGFHSQPYQWQLDVAPLQSQRVLLATGAVFVQYSIASAPYRSEQLLAFARIGDASASAKTAERMIRFRNMAVTLRRTSPCGAPMAASTTTGFASERHRSGIFPLSWIR